MAWIGPIVGGLIKNVNLGVEYPHGFSPLPLIASFEINEECDQRCPYCYLARRKSSSFGKSNEALFPLMKKCVDLGIQFITVSGREPLLDRDSLRYLQSLDSLRHRRGSLLRYGFNTNGLGIDRHLGILRKLAPDWVTLSIDGYEQGHDAQRGQGTFGIVTSNLIRLHSLPQYSGRVEVASTMSSTSVEGDIFELTKYLRDIGVRMHSITPVIEMTSDGRHHQPSSSQLLDYYVQHAEEVKDVEVYFILMKNADNEGILARYSLTPGYKNLMDQDCYRIAETSNIYILSHNATRYFRITSDGHLLRGASLFETDYVAASLGRPSAQSLPAMLREVFRRDMTLDFYKQHLKWLN